MKVIIAGSRNIIDPLIVRAAVDQSRWFFKITEIVHGGCRGVDEIADQQCRTVWPIKVFPADWSLGKKAGPIRNRAMAAYADALIAIPLPGSRGTQNMIEEMQALGKPVYVHPVRGT